MDTIKMWTPVQFDDGGFVRPDDPSPFSWMYAIHAHFPRDPVYLVGSDGAIWTKMLNHTDRQRQTWKRMAAAPTKDGYRGLMLRNSVHGRKLYLVHRIVLETFAGSPKPGRWLGRHLNGKRDDNRLQNLCFGTRKENTADMRCHGTEYWAPGDKNPNAKLSFAKISWAVAEINLGRVRKEIAKDLGVSTSALNLAVNGSGWQNANVPRVAPRPLRRFSKYDERVIVAMRNNGCGLKMITDRLNRPEKSVRDAIKRLCPKDQWVIKPVGSKNHAAKIHESDIPKIKARIEAGETRPQVAASYGVHRRTIGRLLLGQSWSHLKVAAS